MKPDRAGCNSSKSTLVVSTGSCCRGRGNLDNNQNNNQNVGAHADTYAYHRQLSGTCGCSMGSHHVSTTRGIIHLNNQAMRLRILKNICSGNYQHIKGLIHLILHIVRRLAQRGGSRGIQNLMFKRGGLKKGIPPLDTHSNLLSFSGVGKSS